MELCTNAPAFGWTLRCAAGLAALAACAFTFDAVVVGPEANRTADTVVYGSQVQEVFQIESPCFRTGLC